MEALMHVWFVMGFAFLLCYDGANPFTVAFTVLAAMLFGRCIGRNAPRDLVEDDSKD